MIDFLSDGLIDWVVLFHPFLYWFIWWLMKEMMEMVFSLIKVIVE